MKKTIALLGMTLLSGAAWAQVATPQQATAAGIAADKPSDAEMHTQQLLGKLMQQITQLQSELRELERQNIALTRKVDDANAKSAGVNDRVQELQNVQMINIGAAQKQIFAQQKDILGKLWGEQKRDCPDLDAKHQQVKVLQRPDGKRTVRFLCYDGKVLHLGTEIHDPAE